VEINRKPLWIAAAAFVALLTVACGNDSTPATTTAASTTPSSVTPTQPPASTAAAAAAQITGPDAAPPASQTGGFDGAKAYDFTAKLVNFGPRPSGSDAIHQTQDYLIAQLKTFGCTVDTDDFHASTPAGDIAMKNIIAKVPGDAPGVILLLTHYDTKRMDDFVGADDAGSSSGLMLELARNLCAAKKQPNAVWLAFLDGEEAVVEWGKDNDDTYGSREMAASLAASGDLKRVKAVLLADMIGPKNLQIEKDTNSTHWLTDLVWKTAARLGYKDVFVSTESAIEDDHIPFVHRGVPSVDVIDLIGYQQAGYWHTPQDTMDKLSPRSIAIVGHVFIETLAELQQKFH
jgi:glutaminyl-peptide cyclotransferase